MPDRIQGIVIGDDGGRSASRRPGNPLKRLRNAVMDGVHDLLWKCRLYETCGSWDAWCDNHGRWDH
jgi:hypothetical protein